MLTFGDLYDIFIPFRIEKISVGSFDGIHLGHRAIISRIAEKGALCTFHPHPRSLIEGENFKLLTPLREKFEIFEKMGLKNVIFLRFNERLRKTSAEAFIRILKEKTGFKKMIMGEDHHFGKDKQGDFKLMQYLSMKYNFEVEIVENVKIDGFTVKTSLIKELLLKGEISFANKLLGRPYEIRGRVVEGAKIGGKIGFPTANIDVPKDKFLPKEGVYAGKIKLDKTYPCMINIGKKTIPVEKFSVELHIIGFKGNLLGKEIKFELLSFLRDIKKFEKVEDLKEQLKEDKKKVEELCVKIL